MRFFINSLIQRLKQCQKFKTGPYSTNYLPNFSSTAVTSEATSHQRQRNKSGHFEQCPQWRPSNEVRRPENDRSPGVGCKNFCNYRRQLTFAATSLIELVFWCVLEIKKWNCNKNVTKVSLEGQVRLF